jgi:hypothetical protein
MSKRQPTTDPKQLTERTLTRRRLLKGAAGVTAAAAFVPAASGLAAAYFPNKLDIDVQPDDADEFIDVDEHDSVEVANDDIVSGTTHAHVSDEYCVELFVLRGTTGEIAGFVNTVRAVPDVWTVEYSMLPLGVELSEQALQ